MVYHKVPASSDTFQNLSRSNVGERECKLYHELNVSYCFNYNNRLQKVTDFLWFRGNRLAISSEFVKLHIFFTKASATFYLAERLLIFPENSILRKEVFRKKRFIDKTKSSSATMKNSNLPHLGTLLTTQ